VVSTNGLLKNTLLAMGLRKKKGKLGNFGALALKGAMYDVVAKTRIGNRISVLPEGCSVGSMTPLAT